MSEPMTFDLLRHTDVSGVSGTGVVAEGVAWSDGTAELRWKGVNPTSSHHDNGVSSVLAIHGHDGASEIRWHSLSEPYSPLHNAADLIAYGLPYLRVDQAANDKRVVVHVRDEHEWRLWLAALGPENAADASVYVDRSTSEYPQQREWSTPDGRIKVLYLIKAAS